MAVLKDFFIALSQNQYLNTAAKKYGLKIGAQTCCSWDEYRRSN